MFDVYPDRDALAEAAADLTSDALEQALGLQPRASLIGTGGRMPGPVYDRLARRRLDWLRVDVSLSDDRLTAPDHEASNARLLLTHLLTGEAAAARFIPLVQPGATDPTESAAWAEPQLRALTPFTMVWLGVGEDGHVASLFPGRSEGLDPQDPRLVIGVPAGFGDPPLARVSLSLSALLDARQILILIAGPARRAVLETGQDLPVHRVLKQARSPVRVLWAP